MLLLQQFLFLVMASPQSSLVVQTVLLKETQGNGDRIVKEAPLRKRTQRTVCRDCVKRLQNEERNAALMCAVNLESCRDLGLRSVLGANLCFKELQLMHRYDTEICAQGGSK